MRRLWFSCVVILLLITAALLNVRYLEHLVDSITSALSDAQEYALAGDYGSAEASTASAKQRFEDHACYLHITLAHQDIDAIESVFGEIQSYLANRDSGPIYVSANARLHVLLRLLVESEQLNLKNVL